MTKQPTPKKTLCERRGHLWKLSGISKHAHDTCSRCGAHQTRKFTAQEKKNITANRKATRARRLYKINDGFSKAVEGKSGADFMDVADAWAKKYPDRVFISVVDDDHFCTSYLVYITHEDPKGVPSAFTGECKPTWFGTTVWMVSQCSGYAPVPFFMYPSHVESAIKVLTTLKKKAKAYPKRY